MKNFEMLLAGSTEINRMLAAINQITKSTLGMLDSTEIEDSVVIPCGHHHVWKIQHVRRIRKGEESTVRLVVEFWINNGHLEQFVPGELIFSTNPLNQREPALEDVHMTYDALETLVEYLTAYPAYRRKLAPLMKAYEVVK